MELFQLPSEISATVPFGILPLPPPLVNPVPRKSPVLVVLIVRLLLARDIEMPVPSVSVTAPPPAPERLIVYGPLPPAVRVCNSFVALLSESVGVRVPAGSLYVQEMPVAFWIRAAVRSSFRSSV